MKLKKFIESTVREVLNENLHTGLLTRSQMVKLGATGALNKAFERYIPTDQVVGEDPSPADWTDDNGNVKKYVAGDSINSSIEVIYDADTDVYYLQNGNHRLKQAILNNDKYIRAFIQPDKGNIGKDVKMHVDHLNENQNKEVWYHGSDFKFNSFENFKSSGPSALGFFATDDINLAEFFGEYVYRVNVDIKNPYKITMDKWDDIRMEHARDTSFFENMRNRLIEKGYDGILIGSRSWKAINNIEFTDGRTVIVFDKNNIELAKV